MFCTKTGSGKRGEIEEEKGGGGSEEAEETGGGRKEEKKEGRGRPEKKTAEREDWKWKEVETRVSWFCYFHRFLKNKFWIVKVSIYNMVHTHQVKSVFLAILAKCQFLSVQILLVSE